MRLLRRGLRVRGAGLGGIAVFLLLGWIDRWLRIGATKASPSSTITAVLMQIAVALTILAVTVAIPWPADWPGWVVLALFLVIAGVLGAGLGSEGFALSILSAHSGQVAEWQMSGQAVEDYKGFLRLHIAPEGDLTIYPLAIDEVCHDWELADDPAGGKRPRAGRTVAGAPADREPRDRSPRGERSMTTDTSPTTRADHVPRSCH